MLHVVSYYFILLISVSEIVPWKSQINKNSPNKPSFSSFACKGAKRLQRYCFLVIYANVWHVFLWGTWQNGSACPLPSSSFKRGAAGRNSMPVLSRNRNPLSIISPYTGEIVHTKRVKTRLRSTATPLLNLFHVSLPHRYHLVTTS